MTTRAPDLQTLQALMQAGDMLALDQLVRAYSEKLLAVARRRCHQPSDAEDAVQQALLTASQAMTGFRGEGSPLSWLSTLVARTCYRMNEQVSAVHEDGEQPCTCDDPSVVAERHELALSLGEALMSLSRTDRLAFLLAAEGFTSVEIAEQFALTHDAVRSRLKRTRQILRARLDADDTLAQRHGTTSVKPLTGVPSDGSSLSNHKRLSTT